MTGVSGWQGDALQRAVNGNGCFSEICRTQVDRDVSVAMQCRIFKTVKGMSMLVSVRACEP